ncbi:MAG: DNA methyltransferase, partial [Bradymonadales bacterium]
FGYDGHDLELMLVRLLFCMFAEDTGIFVQDDFLNYVENAKPDGSDLGMRLIKLFEVLDMEPEKRAKRTQLPADLLAFQYINGSIFAERLETPEFNASMRQTLIDCALFDWSVISPAIFGAMFQGVLDPVKRRNFGAHYTSEENILKLINPLFMDELWKRFDIVKADPKRLEDLHREIASLRLLDPACGCGNFLIIAYRELRKLEHAIIKMKRPNRQRVLDTDFVSRLRVDQFYGIEIEEFPCQIANVALWLMDHLMNLELSEILGQSYARLPLSGGAHIVHGNALQIDWQTLLGDKENTKFDYIIGNPPFVGHQNRSKEQIQDMDVVYADFKKYGKLDYVAAWYKKAADHMQNSSTQCAFVSTNSIVQGESVAVMWKELFEKRALEIIFAHPTFKWNNEAKGVAAVHCVIVGFVCQPFQGKKRLFRPDNSSYVVHHINGYLLDAPNVFIQNRSKSINPDLPKMTKDSQPTDGKNLLLTADERDALLKQYPEAAPLIKAFMGAEEYIYNTQRYCLWLKDVEPKAYRHIKPIMQRLERVAQARQKSPTASVREAASTPSLFTQIRQPTTNYIVVPRVSSENRKVIPIGFMHSSVIASDALIIIPDAKLYHLGILTSSVHMAWMRTVCGRLKSDYRYSSMVYYNFPWPELSAAQEEKMALLAQKILDTRARYPESSLADLYDSSSLPADLHKAHEALNKAVLKLYGFNLKAYEAKSKAEIEAKSEAKSKAEIEAEIEAEIVASLMRRYAKLRAR